MYDGVRRSHKEEHKKLNYSQIWTGIFCLVSCISANADSLPVYGTGFNSSGSALTQGSTDGNWTIISIPSGSVTASAYVTDGSAGGTTPFESGAWIKDGSDSTTSKWISPSATETSNNASGQYIYQETFSLTGYDPSSVVITGEWAVDNSGYIMVNGTQVATGASGLVANGTLGAFKSFTSFTLNFSNADFISGTNTIDFYVTNSTAGSPNTTGLNVDISSATASAAPEPVSFSLAGIALAALAMCKRKLPRDIR